jgi:hypothetical protein
LQLIVEPRTGRASWESVELPIEVEVVLPIGVMNGDTALVPLDAVTFGVANAGDATTTRADTKTSATSTLLLKCFIIGNDPFDLTIREDRLMLLDTEPGAKTTQGQAPRPGPLQSIATIHFK